MENLKCDSDMNSRKKILYLGHNFHSKTKSSQFLKDILAEKYDLEIFSFDPVVDTEFKVPEHVRKTQYDVLVLFQVVPDVAKLKENIQYNHAAFFPMYDGVGEKEDEFWVQFMDFNVICFSKNLHNRLTYLGLSSHYIQYFPEPKRKCDLGDSSRVFFWHRVSELHVGIVETLLRDFNLTKLHIHKSPDPGQIFVEPSRLMDPLVEYSTWYSTKEEMLAEIEDCGIYISPRPYEGIGMSFLEAMAMGRCVIAPDYPTMNEYIRHGYNGLLYDFQNVHSLKPVDIQRIQRNAYASIKQGFSEWEKDKHKILDWLEAPVEQIDCLKKRDSGFFCVQRLSLFGFVPLMTIKTRHYKKYYDLFDCVRLMKKKRVGAYVRFYLFGFLPFWAIK